MKKYFSNTFLRYLASYAVILLLPLLVIGITSHWFLYSIYINDTLEKNLEIPHNIQLTVDMQILQLDNFSYQVGKNYVFSPSYLKKTPLSYETTKTLSSFNLTNAFIYDVLYYAGKENNLYYGEKGTYSPDILFSSIYPYTVKDSEDFLQIPAKLAKPKWIGTTVIKPYTGQEGEFSTYLSPVHENLALSSQCYLLFLVHKDSFRKVIGSANGHDNLVNIITGSDGSLIYSSSDDYGPGQIQDLVSQTAQTQRETITGWENGEINREEVYINKLVSGSGLVYFSVMSKAVMLEDVNRLRDAFVIIYTCIITVGFALVFFISQYHYRPMKKLSDYMESSNIALKGNVISLAEETIRALRSSSLVYRQEHALLVLLQEGSAQQKAAQLQKAELSLSGPYYQSAIVWIKSIDPNYISEDSETLQAMLQSAFSQESFCYAVKYMERNHYILILSQSTDIQEDYRKQFAFAILNLREVAIEATVYIGKAYSDLDLLHQSYSEAKMAFANQRDTDTGAICYSYTPDSAEQLQTASNADIEALRQAIYQKDIILLGFLSKKIRQFMEQELIDPFLARCTCYSAITAVFQAMEEIRPGWTALISKDVTENLSFSSLGELQLVFKTICSRVILDLGEPQTEKRKLGMQDAVSYIDAHFCDPDFSVKSLAIDYKMAISNFSHQFKSFTGKTVSEYINEKKIHHAKILLTDSSLSIADVAEKSGYLHPSSFIRKFKQEAGITPGEYRGETAAKSKESTDPP